jgi:hypothetical protein
MSKEELESSYITVTINTDTLSAIFQTLVIDSEFIRNQISHIRFSFDRMTSPDHTLEEWDVIQNAFLNIWNTAHIRENDGKGGIQLVIKAGSDLENQKVYILKKYFSTTVNHICAGILRKFADRENQLARALDLETGEISFVPYMPLTSKIYNPPHSLNPDQLTNEIDFLERPDLDELQKELGIDKSMILFDRSIFILFRFHAFLKDKGISYIDRIIIHDGIIGIPAKDTREHLENNGIATLTCNAIYIRRHRGEKTLSNLKLKETDLGVNAR